MIGQKFGHYLIEQKLGEGGMGVVYRARDEKLQRDVALKFLETLPAGGSAGHERVLQEARAISALNHPNICTIYEVGEIEGKPYIAMEFVEGRPLSMEILSSGMGLEQVERYGMQLADALGHAHGRGIIHRDLKAANVMVTPQGRLKVLDFGISRRLEPGKGLDGTTQFDRSWESQHTFTGTLPYVAPEILRGEEGDARSDIWSLGVLLYEMAAGRRPFRGSTAFELSAAILRERAPLITPPLPPILQSVIDRCLDKDPGQRYQSAGEVRAALEAATTSSRSHEYLNVLANREGEGNKHTIRNILLVAIALLLATATGYWFYGRSAAKPKKPMVGAIQSIAVLPLENLSGDPSQDYFADGMTDALITELSQIKKLRVISRTSVMQYKRTQKPLQEIAQELSVDAVVEGSVVRSGKRVRISAKLFQTNVEGALWADNFERNFTDVLALQNDVAAAIARSIQVELSGSENFALGRNRSVVPEAYEDYLRGRYEVEKRTQTSIQRAIEYFQSAIQKDDTFAAAYAGLADAYLNQATREYGHPDELVLKATQAAVKALRLDDGLAEAHVSLAGVRFFFLEGGEIESEFRRAIALDPGYAHGLHWYALFLAASGRSEEAIREIKLASEIDPKSMIIQANIGWIYYLAGDFDRAIEAEKKVVQVDPSFESARSYLGEAYLAKDQFAEAIDEFRTAASLSPGSLSGQAELAAAYARSGDKKAALDILKEIGANASAYDLAFLQAGFRDADATLPLLEKAHSERNARVVNLPVHPHFVFLAKNPKFTAIAEDIKKKLH